MMVEVQDGGSSCSGVEMTFSDAKVVKRMGWVRDEVRVLFLVLYNIVARSLISLHSFLETREAVYASKPDLVLTL